MLPSPVWLLNVPSGQRKSARRLAVAGGQKYPAGHSKSIPSSLMPWHLVEYASIKTSQPPGFITDPTAPYEEPTTVNPLTEALTPALSSSSGDPTIVVHA